MKTTGNSKGFFLQDPGVSSWAGVYVYIGNTTPTVAKGDVVTVRGAYTVYRGNEQIAATGGDADAPKKSGTAALPEPLQVSVSEIATNGPREMELQSMRLRVTNVAAVTSTDGVDFSVRQASTPGGEAATSSSRSPASASNQDVQPRRRSRSSRPSTRAVSSSEPPLVMIYSPRRRRRCSVNKTTKSARPPRAELRSASVAASARR